MHLKPVDGRIVPDPDHGDQLPAAGRTVELTQYWQRRLIDGDVVEAQPQPAAPATPAQAPEGDAA